MKRLLSLLMVVATLAVISCQKTEQVEAIGARESAKVADIQVIDGRLKFASKEEFDKTVQLLFKQQDKLDNFERKFDGFVSVRTAFSKMTEKDNERIATEGVSESYKGYVAIVGQGEDKEIARTIADPILATLVSRDGWLYIGKDAYYLTRDKFKQVLNSSATQIANIMVGRSTNSDVKNGTVSHQLRNLAGAKVAGSQTCIREYWAGNNKRRMAGDVDYAFYNGPNAVTLYKSVTVMTKHQRRTLGTIWSLFSTNRLELSGRVTIGNNTTPNTTVDNFAFVVDDTDQITKSYPSFCTPVPGIGEVCDQFYSNVNSTHSGKSRDNVDIGTCTIVTTF